MARPASGASRAVKAYYAAMVEVSNALLRAFANCAGPDEPPRYPPVLAGTHIEARLLELQHALVEAKSAG